MDEQQFRHRDTRRINTTSSIQGRDEAEHRRIHGIPAPDREPGPDEDEEDPDRVTEEDTGTNSPPSPDEFLQCEGYAIKELDLRYGFTGDEYTMYIAGNGPDGLPFAHRSKGNGRMPIDRLVRLVIAECKL